MKGLLCLQIVVSLLLSSLLILYLFQRADFERLSERSLFESVVDEDAPGFLSVEGPGEFSFACSTAEVDGMGESCQRLFHVLRVKRGILREVCTDSPRCLKLSLRSPASKIEYELEIDALRADIHAKTFLKLLALHEQRNQQKGSQDEN